MTKIDRARRPRRIAADEAHAWARNLRLGNHHAKSVLRSLTLYVNGEGEAFVGIEQLADDCELSADTVRRRLVWLEEIGAIMRVPQWIDSKGNRTAAEGGKRTTDLIALLWQANTEAIEARARGETVDDGEAHEHQFSPSSQQGLNQEGETVSPAPALGQPSQSCDPLISEPEPESSPLPPSRGRESAAPDDEGEEPALFASAWTGWRGHEVMRRDLALAEFRKLGADDQQLCRSAIGPYNAALDRNHRSKTRENFHIWIRRRGFDEFKSTPTLTNHAADSDEARAIMLAFDLVGRLEFLRTVLRSKIDGSIPYRLSVTPRLRALASPPPREAWAKLSQQQAAAWDAFLDECVPFPTRKRIAEGSLAPWLWPPRKDGSIYNEGIGE